MKPAKIKTVFAVFGLLLASYGDIASASVLATPIQENKTQIDKTSVYQPTKWQVALLCVVLVSMKLKRNGKHKNSITFS